MYGTCQNMIFFGKMSYTSSFRVKYITKYKPSEQLYMTYIVEHSMQYIWTKYRGKLSENGECLAKTVIFFMPKY